MKNIEKISRNSDISLVIRIPIIPGYNDSVENIANTIKFIRQLRKVERIELLPYHRFGVSTYEVLNRDYLLLNLEAPNEDHLHYLKEVIKSYDFNVQIGG